MEANLKHVFSQDKKNNLMWKPENLLHQIQHSMDHVHQKNSSILYPEVKNIRQEKVLKMLTSPGTPALQWTPLSDWTANKSEM